MVAKGPPTLSPSLYHLAMAQQNQRQSPLLRLPAELRQRIYDMALDFKTDKVLHEDYPEWDRLNLSRTCRQTFAEIASDYFTTKLLPLSDPRGINCRAHTWATTFTKLTPSQRNCITTIVMGHWDYKLMYVSGYYTLLQKLPNLRIFGIRGLSTGLSPALCALEVGRRLRPFTTARPTMYQFSHKPLVLE